MPRTLEAAAMEPGEIGCINAHGTATLASDAVETVAIKKMFGATAVIAWTWWQGVPCQYKSWSNASPTFKEGGKPDLAK